MFSLRHLIIAAGDFPKSPSAAALSIRGEWLKLPAWKVGDRGYVPRSAIQVSKKQMFFLRSLLRIQYVGEGSFRDIHLAILRRFSRPRLAYMCTHVA